MPTADAKTKPSTEQVLREAAQLSWEECNDFLRRLTAVRRPPKARRLSKRESELLRKINRGPPPWRQVYDGLIEKRRTQPLTPPQRRQLFKLVDQMEAYNARWRQWLVDLASIRKLNLDELMKHLRLPKHP